MLKREFIPVGKENAISRRDLCRITGLSDRQVRHDMYMELDRVNQRINGIECMLHGLPENTAVRT